MAAYIERDRVSLPALEEARAPAPWLPADHEAFLAELSKMHGTAVIDRAVSWLRARGPLPYQRWQRSCREPLLYTLERRRNFFRAAFSHRVGELVGQPQVGEVAAVAGEITWTCALVADDIIDGSTEREGHPSAHIRYGTLRASISTLIGVWTAFAGLLRRSPAAMDARLRMARLWTFLLLRCVWSQVPFRRTPTDLAEFAAHARNVNSSTHWALLAPVAACADRRLLTPLEAYADAISVNGKMRNDLLDYCGGSTESTTVYRDFDARQMTFPIIVLWQQCLSDTERFRIRRHFLQRWLRSSLTVSELFQMFQTHHTLEECLALMRRQADMAARAIDEIERLAPLPPAVSTLLRDRKSVV